MNQPERTYSPRGGRQAAGRVCALGLAWLLLTLAAGCAGLGSPSGEPQGRELTVRDIQLIVTWQTGWALLGKQWYYRTAYRTIEPAQIKAFWRESGLNLTDYKGFRCGNFARRFAAYMDDRSLRDNAGQWWAVCEFGVEGHAQNCFIDSKRKLWIFEPQTGEMWPASRKERLRKVVW